MEENILVLEKYDNVIIGLMKNFQKKYENNELYWTTRDRKHLLLQEMELDHLKNLYKYLDKRKEDNTTVYLEWLYFIGWELNKRGIDPLTLI